MATFTLPYLLTDDLIPLMGAGPASPPLDPPDEPEGELAVAAVSASSDDGNVPANAVDRNLNTRWSALGAGEWLELDFGEEVTLGAVEIAWYRRHERSHRFDLAVPDGNGGWRVIYRGQSAVQTGG